MKPLAKAITTTENGKLGDASTTYVAQQSCPDSCTFLKAGCYAERGFVGMHLTRMLNVAGGGRGPLEVAEAEAEAIDKMATVVDRPLRLHTVGDCSTNETARIVSAAAERYTDRGGGLVWTYTHAWRDVERESWGRVSVLASCETRADVEAAAARGYATAIVVDDFRGQARYEHDGIDLLPCPEMTRKVPCSECRLCFDDVALRERGYSIGFQIHGDPVTKRWARASLAKREEPCPTESSTKSRPSANG